MSMLGQCLDILSLTSLDLEEDQKSTIAHCVRLWKKCKNNPESTIAVMHEVYSRLSFAQVLFDCDASDFDGFEEEEKALKLLSPTTRRTRIIGNEGILKRARFNANIPFELRKDDRRICDYIHKATIWSTPFKLRLDAIGENALARAVALYDFEDMKEKLNEPEEFSDYGPSNFALPWKDKYCVPSANASSSERLVITPLDNDKVVHLLPSEDERRQLVTLYTRASEYLQGIKAPFSCYPDYPPEEDAKRQILIDSFAEKLLNNDLL